MLKHRWLIVLAALAYLYWRDRAAKLAAAGIAVAWWNVFTWPLPGEGGAEVPAPAGTGRPYNAPHGSGK